MALTLKITLPELLHVMEYSESMVGYLDTETGEIIELPSTGADGLQELIDMVGEDAIPVDPDTFEDEIGVRFLEVPQMASFEGYEDMEDFIQTVVDSTIREELEDMIQGSGAFRRFKDCLLGYPAERTRWFEFKEARMRDRALEWLAEEDIKLED